MKKFIIEHPNTYGLTDESVFCSHCGVEVEYVSGYTFSIRYCPNCGKKWSVKVEEVQGE